MSNTDPHEAELRELDAVDVRIRWTANLEERAVWLPTHRLLLLDHSVTHAEAAEHVRALLVN